MKYNKEEEKIMQNKVVPNREYKSGLFAFVFNDKEKLLSLYNAVNGSHYTDPDDLEVYTMEGILYMGVKNDLSFLIDWRLAVFEHQSTYNPNMPLRGFIYMASAFKKYIALNRLDVYSSRRLRLPIPRYYVFYNGTREMEDEVVLRLTDSMEGEDAAEQSCAEFKAHMVNINRGHSSELMKKCPLLYEYSCFVAEVRERLDGEKTLLEAIDGAVEECIRVGILADILRAHRSEVTDMLLKEYDAEFHISCEKKISYEEGFEEGVKREKDRADTARREADEANRKVDEANRKADEAEQKAEEEHRKVEILIRRLRSSGCAEEEIAAALDMPTAAIRECVREISKEKS